MLQTIMPPSVLQIKRKIQTTKKKNYVTQSTFLQNKKRQFLQKCHSFQTILFKKKKKNQVVFGNDKPKLNTVNATRHFKDGMNIPTNQRAF